MRNSNLNEKKDWEIKARIDVLFYKWGGNIIARRIKIEKENPHCPNGMRRFTKAFINLIMKDEKLKKEIEERLINADWEEDRWINC